MNIITLLAMYERSGSSDQIVSGKLVTPTALLAYLKFVLAVRAPT